MPRLRVYLPLSADDLTALAEQRTLPSGQDVTGFAVTPALRDALAEVTDEEVLEQAASEFAAVECAARDHAVVVGAADVNPVDAVPDDDGATVGNKARVSIAGGVTLTAIAAFLVGDDVTEGTTERAQPDEFGHIVLSWYDTTELDHVRELLA